MAVFSLGIVPISKVRSQKPFLRYFRKESTRFSQISPSRKNQVQWTEE
jgi:hypothetical protein